MNVFAENTATGRALKGLDLQGPDRWVTVELVKNRLRNPIKVTLFEGLQPGFTKVGTAIGFDFTTASPEAIRKSVETILVSVGQYASVIGTYGKEEAK